MRAMGSFVLDRDAERLVALVGSDEEDSCARKRGVTTQTESNKTRQRAVLGESGVFIGEFVGAHGIGSWGGRPADDCSFCRAGTHQVPPHPDCLTQRLERAVALAPED